MGGASLPSPGRLFGDRRRTSSATSGLQLLATCLLSATLALMLIAIGEPLLVFGIVGAAALIGIGLLKPALFLSVFLLLRPLVDDLSQLTAGLPSANVGGGLGVLIVGVAVVHLASGQRFKAPPGAAALLAVAAISGIAAAEAIFLLGPTIGLEPVSELVRLAAMLAVYLLAAKLVRTPEKVRALLVLVALSAVAPALWGLFNWIFDPVVSEGYDYVRISGTFTGPNAFGGYLAVCALLLIFLPEGSMPRRVRLLSLAVVLAALVGTYSRVGFIICMLGVVVLGYRHNRMVVVAGLLAAVTVVAAIPNVRERVLPSEESGGQAREGYESYGWRINNWKGLLAQWERRPVLGNGLYTTTYVNPRGPADTAGQPGGGYDAHNSAVKLLVEGGVVLLGAWVLFLGILLVQLRRMAKDRWELRDYGHLVAVVWALVLVAALTTDDPLALTAMMYALLAMTGALAGAYAESHRRVT